MEHQIVVYKRPRRMTEEWKEAEHTVVLLAENGVCKGPKDNGVRPGYVRDEALRKADYILLARGGFLLAESRTSTNQHIYISVVCGNRPGVGKALITRALQLGREYGMRYSSLHALPSVLEYYPRFGFQLPGGEKKGDDTDGYFMQKNLRNLVNWRPKPSPEPRRSKRLSDTRIVTPNRAARRPRKLTLSDVSTVSNT